MLDCSADAPKPVFANVNSGHMRRDQGQHFGPHKAVMNDNIGPLQGAVCAKRQMCCGPRACAHKGNGGCLR